jgi:hypothetical protein
MRFLDARRGRRKRDGLTAAELDQVIASGAA